jgi:hypothetical protein
MDPTTTLFISVIQFQGTYPVGTVTSIQLLLVITFFKFLAGLRLGACTVPGHTPHTEEEG